MTANGKPAEVAAQKENEAPILPDSGDDSGISGAVSDNVAATIGAEDVDKVIEKVSSKMDISGLGPEHKSSLRALIGKSIRNPNFNPEDDPAIFDAAIKQLKAWGFTYEYGKEKEEAEDAKRVESDNKAEEEIAHLNRLIRKKKMPTLKYDSYVHFYQYDTQPDEKGGLIYTKGSFDKAVDDFENHVRISGDVGGNLITSLWRKGLRRKATVEEAARNASELGLSAYFEPVMDGEKVIAIKENVTDVAGGVILDDLLRARAEHAFLQKFDQKEALIMAAKMIEDVHEKSGRGVGEILGNDIVLQVQGEGDEARFLGARLALPDVICEEGVAAVEQKAMDLTDFCMSVGCAGWQEMKNEDPEISENNAKANIEAVINNYKNPEVKAKCLLIMKEGRPRDTIHNRQRFGFDTLLLKADKYERVRALIIETLGGAKSDETPE